MKTVSECIASVKSSPEKLNHWLQRQFIGEALAALRVKNLAESLTEPWQRAGFTMVAEDEMKHAEWILLLLQSRKIPVPKIKSEQKVFASTTRYWKHLSNGMTLEELFAAGAHAEEMRLHRIQALADDPEIDTDIRETFLRILKDEIFHAKVFRKAAGEAAYEKAAGNHQRGLEALGLVL